MPNDSVNPQQNNMQSDEERLKNEISELEKFRDEKLKKAQDIAEEQIKKILAECEQEIQKRIEFNKAVSEALAKDPSNQELQKILQESQALLEDLEKNVRQQIIKTKEETSNNFSMGIKQINDGIEEGHQFSPVRPKGTPQIVTQKPKSDLDKYCEKMGELRKSISSFVLSIPKKLEGLSSLLKGNKDKFNSLEQRFASLNLKQDASHTKPLNLGRH